jgi:hypothetical protein
MELPGWNITNKELLGEGGINRGKEGDVNELSLFIEQK